MHELLVNGDQPNGHINGVYSSASNSSLPTPTAEPSNGTKDIKKPEPPKRRKSVRFSPNVESTTFQHSDPPNTNHSPDVASKVAAPEPLNGDSISETVSCKPSPITGPVPVETACSSLDMTTNVSEVENKEHFQLSPEEAFFLVFSLGALSVVDPVNASPIPTEHLLRLFRSYSYFPPRSGGLRPDDPFLVNYAVYHHFRSLGWVPRHGIKFGVDWILYQRGPVFDHSEFGIMILPSFSDPAWDEFEHEVPKRSWSWLMGVNRVLSHVLKSLVLVYVDIPTPTVFEESMERGGIAAGLKKYTIREVMVRRFSVNRNR
jgi:tRNA-splicing endonuclease subunit Sen2